MDVFDGWLDSSQVDIKRMGVDLGPGLSRRRFMDWLPQYFTDDRMGI